jgi:hypothetical protein
LLSEFHGFRRGRYVKRVRSRRRDPTSNRWCCQPPAPNVVHGGFDLSVPLSLLFLRRHGEARVVGEDKLREHQRDVLLPFDWNIEEEAQRYADDEYALDTSSRLAWQTRGTVVVKLACFRVERLKASARTILPL